jgi:hypothetical protein
MIRYLYITRRRQCLAWVYYFTILLDPEGKKQNKQFNRLVCKSTDLVCYCCNL